MMNYDEPRLNKEPVDGASNPSSEDTPSERRCWLIYFQFLVIPKLLKLRSKDR